MTFLNLSKRLQPARKAWKIFTSKLNSKLHKLNTSKAIKKPKTRLKPTTTKPLPWPAASSFQPRLLHRKRRTNTIQSTTTVLRRLRLQKRSSPAVYIDDLFIEPVSPAPTLATSKQKLITDKCSTKAKLHEQPRPGDDVPGTSNKEGEGEVVCGGGADDMWESLGLASPLMHGINERAEEFIARIRAEMQIQETMARLL